MKKIILVTSIIALNAFNPATSEEIKLTFKQKLTQAIEKQDKKDLFINLFEILSGNEAMNELSQPKQKEIKNILKNDENIEALQKVLLDKNYSFGELTLVGIKINPKALKAILEGLKNQNKLRSLTITNATLGSKRAKRIAKFLVNNTSLKVIDLSENKITDDAAEAFAKALKANKTLKQLNLSFNKFTFQGAKEIAEALKESKALTQLYMTDQDPGLAEEEKKILEKMTKKNFSKYLYYKINSKEFSISRHGTF